MRPAFGRTRSMWPYLISVQSKNIYPHRYDPFGSPTKFLRADKPWVNFLTWNLSRVTSFKNSGFFLHERYLHRTIFIGFVMHFTSVYSASDSVDMPVIVLQPYKYFAIDSTPIARVLCLHRLQNGEAEARVQLTKDLYSWLTFHEWPRQISDRQEFNEIFHFQFHSGVFPHKVD